MKSFDLKFLKFNFKGQISLIITWSSIFIGGLIEKPLLK